MKKLLSILAVVLLISCQEKEEKITNNKDYDPFLISHANVAKAKNQEQLDFWNAKFLGDSTNLVEMSQLAGVHNARFGITGDVNELHTAEKLLLKSHEVAVKNKDSYLRSLAHNYISQHRFKEAQVLLDSAYVYKDNRDQTELMLFDVAMELGNYDRADSLLGKIKDPKDFNYLIRLAKWSDHQGNLDAAIKYLEQAKTIAEERDSEPLKLWIYSNIGDFYGHAGRLKDSYNSYLQTLKLDPENHYVKKQLAWIIFSKEKNTEEANRILDSVIKDHNIPDYHLLKAEMAEYSGDAAEVKNQQKAFVEAVNSANYGGMYNTYLINMYADSDPKKALALAEQEIQNRATPETYQLLAYSQLQAGDKKAALATIEEHVIGKTYEPKALLHAAMIYKANGLNEKVTPLKEELEGAFYELGPVKAKKIEKL